MFKRQQPNKRKDSCTSNCAFTTLFPTKTYLAFLNILFRCYKNWNFLFSVCLFCSNESSSFCQCFLKLFENPSCQSHFAVVLNIRFSVSMVLVPCFITRFEMPFHLVWCKKCFLRILTPEKSRHKKNKRESLVSVGKRFRRIVFLYILQADRCGTHFNLSPRWWLGIIDWKMSTLRLIDFCTCSLSLLSSFAFLSFGDTDGMKRRFIVKINKKSINLRRSLFVPSARYYMMATSAK